MILSELDPKELAAMMKAESEGLEFGEVNLVLKIQDGKMIHATISRTKSIKPEKPLVINANRV